MSSGEKESTNRRASGRILTYISIFGCSEPYCALTIIGQMLDDAVMQARHFLDAIGGQHVVAGNDDGLEEAIGHRRLGRRVLRENTIHPYLILVEFGDRRQPWKREAGKGGRKEGEGGEGGEGGRKEGKGRQEG